MTRPGALFVDDDQDIGDILQFILEADGYSIIRDAVLCDNSSAVGGTCVIQKKRGSVGYCG